MSSNNVNRSKDIALKSRIPVPVYKSKNNIDNVQEMKLHFSEFSLPKCVNTLQKVPGQLRNQPYKIESLCTTQTIKPVNYSNKNLVKPHLQSSSSLPASQPNRILKQLNQKVKSDVCKKKINSNSDIKSGLLTKERPTKVISRINAKENKNESKKVILEVGAKKIDDAANKITVTQKNDIVKNIASRANEKEKIASKPDYISSQKDIKFESSDFFRNMILSNKELSPSILKLQPGLKLSSVHTERPSIYQNYEMPSNPFQEALRSIERKMSSAKKDRKQSAIKQSPFRSSPFKEHNSFHSPLKDPRAEAMKSIEAMKSKQYLRKNLKNAKKVSFNLNVEEFTPQASLDYKPTPFKNSESRLTQINEKSEENTPTSPQNCIKEISSTEYKNNEQTELVASIKELCESSEPKATSESVQNSQCMKTCSLSTSDNIKFNTPETKLTAISSDVQSNAITAWCENVPKEISTDSTFRSLRKIHFECLSPSSNCDNRRALCGTLSKDIRRMSFQNSINVLDIKGSEARLYTPRPISINKSTFVDVSSPDFLTKDAKGKFMSSFAPIRTPFVLKNLAECLLSPEGDLSPVRLKLDFTEEERESPKKEIRTKSFNLPSFKKIMTTQKFLDELADKECSLCLVNETIPVVCGRYLQNPVALTLSEGDEMHFIPI